jgi:hypothetical protein
VDLGRKKSTTSNLSVLEIFISIVDFFFKLSPVEILRDKTELAM